MRIDSKTRVALAALFVTATALGCSDDTACSETSDCFSGETCVSGECVVASNNANNANNANNLNNVNNSNNINNINNSNNTNNLNNTNNTNNSNNATNNATNNANNSNNATNNSNNATNNSTNNTNGLECVVDLFASCEDPFELDGMNNSWTDADRPGGSAGCVVQRDTVRPLNVQVTGRLCHNEAGDWYGQTIVPCDTTTLTAEVRLTPTTMCLPELFDLRFNRAGAEWDCSDARIQCSQEGEDKIIRWSIPPANSVDSFYFGVSSDGPNGEPVDLDYTLEIKVQ